MDEHIKELTEQAGLIEYGMPENMICGDQTIESFAKLVAEECATIADKTHNSAEVGNLIRKQFGVI
jgi:hypothetical protein